MKKLTTDEIRNFLYNEKLSQHIRYAIEALEEFENTPKCKVNMYTFHAGSGHVCVACLGGIAAIKRANAIGEFIHHRGMLAVHADAVDKILAYEHMLNDIRDGNILAAYERLGGKVADIPEEIDSYINVPNYHTAPKAFKRTMLDLADKLETYNL